MMTPIDLSVEEICARGSQIYDQKLRSILEPQHVGKYVVIDIQTGEYEMDEDHLVASDRAAARWPGAPLYGARVGYQTIGRLGVLRPLIKA